MKTLIPVLLAAAGAAVAAAQPAPLSPATLLKIRSMAPLFDGRTLDGWIPDPARKGGQPYWTVRHGAICSTGAGRGVLYTRGDYSRYRIIFEVRHVSGRPDHQPCVLVFCRRPPGPAAKGLDALGAIQFQVPNGGHWDYRPGHNDAGKDFSRPVRTRYDDHAWAQVEILVDAAKGVVRMAVAQPVGTRGVENLDFANPAAGRPGPFALQIHNGGLFDEYRDLRIEVNPADERLITAE